jgi:hypothetical protein
MLGSYDFLQLQNLLALEYQGRRLDIRPFQYVFDFAAVADGTSAVATAKIVGNADFWVCGIAANSLSEAQSVLNASLQIEDSGSQERFFDEPSLIGQVAYSDDTVTACLARGVPYPRKVAGNSTLTATLAGRSAITSPQVMLDGVHVYVYGN